MSYINENYELEEQIKVNSIQLHDLSKMAHRDSINTFIYLSGLLFLVFLLLIIGALFLFPDFTSIVRREIIDYSGIIAVFICLGIVRISEKLFETWGRKDDVSFVINQQKESIGYAINVLNDENYKGSLDE
ncbi:MAG: hypothetical protein HAW67_06650 [Endozoicomonadaceae bacterium]|nr:hypothetical protein [Endozoicomonadaceae bacterium]